MSAKELGVGTRVWVGWCADEHMVGVTVDPRTQTGTIIGGPFDQPTGAPFWGVTMDSGNDIVAREPILYPIDDGDPEAEPERADRPEEVGA